MNKQVIPVFFATDKSYVPYLSVAIRSLIDNASNDYNYDINIIYEGLDDKTKNTIINLAKPGFNIIFTEMKQTADSFREKANSHIKNTYFSFAIYFRIFIAYMFPEYDKGIYLDSDIVVPGDISQLYNIDLKDNLIGGVKDESVSDVKDFAEYIENVVGINRYEYINSGVLLLNMKKLREVSFADHFLYLFNKYNFTTVAPDQDYINAMCKDNILFLPYKWDAMPVEGKPTIDNPQIIHFNLFLKPWHKKNVDYSQTFWLYANKTVYKDEILNTLNNYDSQKQADDDEKLFAMLKLARDAQTEEVTFKNIFESGKENRV